MRLLSLLSVGLIAFVAGAAQLAPEDDPAVAEASISALSSGSTSAWKKQMAFCKVLEVYCLHHDTVAGSAFPEYLGASTPAASCVEAGEKHCHAEGLGWLFKAIGETEEEKQDQLAPEETVQSVTIGKGASTLCGGIVRPDKFTPSAQHPDAVQIDVDTSACNFRGTPQYAVTVVDPRAADKPFGGWLSGSSTIAVSAANGFRLLVWDPSRSAELLMRTMIHRAWQISWIGDTGGNTGMSAPGHTGWKAGEHDGVIYADISTKGCRFQGTPHYFTALQGHPTSERAVFAWRTQGANVVHTPTPYGFRVYVTVPHKKSAALAKIAEHESWVISWIGISADDIRAGQSDPDAWKGGRRKGTLETAVFGTSSTVDRASVFVTALEVGTDDWAATGDGLLHATKSGALQYDLGEPVCCSSEPSLKLRKSSARQQRWHVVYVNVPETQAEVEEARMIGGHGASSLCGDTTLAGLFQVSHAHDDAIYVDVDTRACAFRRKPAYAASLVEAEAYSHPYDGRLTGTNSIVMASASGFRVILWDPTKNAQKFLQTATERAWRISWIADTGSNTGETLPGLTRWKQGPSPRVIYTDVDTRGCEFRTTPRYFTALQNSQYASFGLTQAQSKSELKFWRTQGVNVVHSPTSTGFRVYVTAPHYSDPGLANRAEKEQWQVTWIGIPDYDRRGESVKAKWRKDHRKLADGTVVTDSMPSSLFTEVPTSNVGFEATPSYVASLVVSDLGWKATGDIIVHTPTKKRFQLDLGRVLDDSQLSQAQQMSLTYASREQVRVSYIGYTLPINLPGGSPDATVLTLEFNATLDHEIISHFHEWKQREFAEVIAHVIGVEKKSVHVKSAGAATIEACTNSGGCQAVEAGVLLLLQVKVSALYCAMQGLDGCDPLSGRLELANYLSGEEFVAMVIKRLQRKGVRVRINKDSVHIGQPLLIENRENWAAKAEVKETDSAEANSWGHAMQHGGSFTKLLIGLVVAGAFGMLSIRMSETFFKTNFQGSNVVPGYEHRGRSPSPGVPDEESDMMQEYGRTPGQYEQRRLLEK